MELAHSLLLNEEALSRIPENKRPVFIFEWLRFLDKVLVAAQKSDIKESQQKLISQLSNEMTQGRGPPTRKLIASCLATIFSVGDTSALFEMINKCNEIFKNKDDSPTYLSTKLAAVACIGEMYERLGRMVGRSYEETISLLLKLLKNAESQLRCEIMLALKKMVMGLGSAGSNCHKEIHKASKNLLSDRAASVKSAAAVCLCELINQCSWMYYGGEVENMVNVCFRAMDGASYEARCDIAHLLGCLLAAVLSVNPKIAPAKSKLLKLPDVLSLLSAGMTRVGSGFLKGGESKNNGNVNRDIRVGVTYAYVEFVRRMGSQWLERNLSQIISHLFSLVSNPRNTAYHIDAVHARKCSNYVLRQLIGGMLGEKAQVAAAKELCATVAKHMSVIDSMSDSTNVSCTNEHLLQNQHVLMVALQELSILLLLLDTSASSLISEPSTSIIEPLVSVLLHLMPAPRLSAAWCLRCVAIAMPSQMTILIDRCASRMQHLKSSPEAISGFSGALAALLGGVRETKLGIPHSKGKQIFLLGEELLRTATQNSRLSLQRTQSGWMLLSALMSLGSAVGRVHLPRMLHLWKISFPRSAKEMEAERLKGDAFTWQVTLENRAGALTAMQSFLTFCGDLVTGEVTKRMMVPLESALATNLIISSIVKSHGGQLKATAAVVRLRLYSVLSLLPPELYENSFGGLLRELVAEYTLADNPGNTTTSMLGYLCHDDDSVIMGKSFMQADHKILENQLQTNSAAGSGTLEHDPTHLFLTPFSWSQAAPAPGPLPLGVSVIDASIRLFGQVFPRVANKHRLQMMDHFGECIKQNKSTRQQAIQVNVFTAVLCALKCLAESKTGFGSADVRKAAIELVEGVLQSNNPALRCAAGEAMGRMVQVVGEGKFLAEMAQYSFDKLKTARDAVTRTGHSLALGCLHRYVGGMGAGQHLHTSVSILLALAQDQTSPVVQVWSLHALALIADSGGPMFRTFVEPTLSLVLQLLLAIPSSHLDVLQCLGRCLAALITTIGPELHATNSTAVATARLYCLVCCGVMQDHSDPTIQAQAVSCLQQLHLFTPRHVNLSTLVPHLCDNLSSKHIQLRRATVSCLRQLVQREASEVSEHALVTKQDLVPSSLSRSALNAKPKQVDGDTVRVSEVGLETSLFILLDRNTDAKLGSHAKDTINSLLQALVNDNLQGWLSLIKKVLHSSPENSMLSSLDSSNFSKSALNSSDRGGSGVLNEEEEDEDEDIKMQSGEGEGAKREEVFKWPTRVFAMECLLKVIRACETSHTLCDTTKTNASKTQGTSLISHLSELVRMSFIAATSESDKLRLAGLTVLQEIITRFSKVPESEFPGHVVLEQYQAQVGAALRPAFSPETAPDVTAAACEVCSRWIGSGVARDLNDLRRVHQLLVSSLMKLTATRDPCLLYSESALTMEKLSVLKAWAEVYIVTMEEEEIKKQMQQQQQQQQQVSNRQEDFNDDFDDFSSTVAEVKEEGLLWLVHNEIGTLSSHWISLLRDYAYLSLPPEYNNQLPIEGGAFYCHDTLDTARPHYKNAWPSALYALCLWIKQVGFCKVDRNDLRFRKVVGDDKAQTEADEGVLRDRFFLLLGVCTEAMCNPTSVQTLNTVNMCLKALRVLLEDPWCSGQLAREKKLSVELLNMLHRLLLTRDSTECFQLIISLVGQIVHTHQVFLAEVKKQNPAKQKELENGETCKKEEEWAVEGTNKEVGEGGVDGNIVPGKSVSFASLEVCLCVLVRHMPSLNPSILSSSFSSSPLFKQPAYNQATVKLLTSTVHLLSLLPSLCSPQGCFSILPSLLFLTTGIIKEVSTNTHPLNISPLLASALHTFKAFCQHPATWEEEGKNKWMSLLQSALLSLVSDFKTDDQTISFEQEENREQENAEKKGKEEKKEEKEKNKEEKEKMEKETLTTDSLMLAVTIFFITCPPSIVTHPQVFHPSIRMFFKCWQAGSSELRLKCLQSLVSICQKCQPDVSQTVIKSLAPPILSYIVQSEKPVLKTSEINIHTEAAKLLECLVLVCDEAHCEKMLQVVVPLLISMLDTQDTPPTHHCKLHEVALQKLIDVATQFRSPFQALIQQNPSYRGVLEKALQAHHASKNTPNTQPSPNTQAAKQAQALQQPSIKLKMDFSNFNK